MTVRYSNLGPILHHFGDIAVFCSWPYPYSTLILGVFPLDQIAHHGSAHASLKVISREIIFEIFQPMWSRYLNVTDGQTDGRTDDILWHNRAVRNIAR